LLFEHLQLQIPKWVPERVPAEELKVKNEKSRFKSTACKKSLAETNAPNYASSNSKEGHEIFND